MNKKIEISIYEFFIQVFILFFSIWCIGWAMSIWKIQGGQSCFTPSDFNTFYQAASGNYLYTWVYKNYTLILFKPLTWFNPTTSYLLLMSLSVTCFMLLTHYLLKVKYGWITILIALPAYHDIIQVGNIDIILAFLYISPIAALFGILLKPHHIVFSCIHTIKLYIQRKYYVRNINT
jgi:hypothetical protein